MKIEVIKGTGIAVISGGEVLVKDAQSALEMAITVKYKTGATKIVLAKETVSEHFFILSTGLAGEILQKFTNYQIKAAVYGDYSRYTSKPLRDFIFRHFKQQLHGRSLQLRKYALLDDLFNNQRNSHDQIG